MRINERESYFWYWRIRDSFIFLQRNENQTSSISGRYKLWRTWDYEEPDACHLDKLTYEQAKKVPVKGDVFILNLRCEGGSTGLYREVTEIRGCYRVVDDSHPRFIICDEFRNERLTGRKALLRSDFYAGIAKVRLVDRIYYKSGKDGLTWEQLAVENF